MKCPKCQFDLAMARHPDGAVWRCGDCLQSVANLAVLRRRLGADVVLDFWRHSHNAVLSSRHCPSCSKHLKSINISKGSTKVEIEICRTCQMLSFEKDVLSFIGGHSSKHPRLLPEGNKSALCNLKFDSGCQDMTQVRGLMSEMAITTCIEILAAVVGIILDSS